jgi:hypothetical protein
LAIPIGKEHIDSTQFLRHYLEQCVEKAQIADVGTHGYDAGSQLLDRSVECFLVATRDRDLGAHFLEQFCGGQADSAAAARDHCNLPL